MANAKRKPQRKAPSAEALVRATITDLRRIASTSKGKMKYLPDLDKVLEEIYGVKGIGSKFCSGKKQAIDKIMKKIDFKSLVLMIKGSERGTKGLLAAVVIAHSKLETDLTKTAKELKKDRKTITEACKRLRRIYHIEKYKDPSDISVDDLKDYLDQNDDFYYDYDEYDYDDDDYGYDDYDRKIELSGGPSAIEKLFDSYKDNRRNDDYYDEDEDDDYDDCDDENEEIRKSISSGDMANERIDTLITKVINPLIDKIDASQRYQASIEEKLDRLRTPAPTPERSRYVPLPQEVMRTQEVPQKATQIKPDPQLTAISKALTSINSKVIKTDQKLTNLTSEFDRMNDVVRGLVNDVYAEEDTEEDDDDINDPDLVSMDAVTASFTGARNPVEIVKDDGFHKIAEDYEDQQSPISLKNMSE